MNRLFSIIAAAAVVAVLAALAPSMAAAAESKAESAPLPARVLGKADAPVTVEDFSSLTCPHCGDFYVHTMPELKKKYIDTGKVRFILRDFPLDGLSLKATAIAHCMPEEQYYPFIAILYENQKAWALAPDPEKVLIQYAKLGGLGDDKAKACLNDTALQERIVAERQRATDTFNIQATPTFILNNGAARIDGARPMDDFAAAIDRLLDAAKKSGKAADKKPTPAAK